MENVFNLIITKIASLINKDKLYSEMQYWQMYHGLQILSYNVLTAAFILILATIIHCFVSSLVVFIVFATFRILADGYHFNRMWKCILATTSIIIGSGKCAQFINFSLPFTIILCIALNIVLLSYMPRERATNSRNDTCHKLQRQLLRIVSIITTFLGLCFPQFRSNILLAMIFAVIFLFPLICKNFPDIK